MLPALSEPLISRKGIDPSGNRASANSFQNQTGNLPDCATNHTVTEGAATADPPNFNKDVIVDLWGTSQAILRILWKPSPREKKMHKSMYTHSVLYSCSFQGHRSLSTGLPGTRGPPSQESVDLEPHLDHGGPAWVCATRCG